MPGPDPPRFFDTHRLRLGLRREGLILLPASLVLLLVVSTVTLFAYRNGLQLLADSRREEAARAVRTAATRLAPAGSIGDGELRQAAPDALGVAVLDADGRPLVVVGEMPAADLLAPLAGAGASPAVGLGPDAEVLPGRVAGFALLPGGGGRLLRLDLPAGVLAAQLRTLEVLLWVVLGGNGAVLLLVLGFLGRLLSPYEKLLARARQLGSDGGGEEDEVAFLLSTFERAVAALTREQERRGGEEVEEDIQVLERTLAGSLESGLLLLDREGHPLSLNPVGAGLLELEPPPAGASLSSFLLGHGELVAVLEEAVEARHGVQRREVASGDRTLGLTVHPLRRDDGEVRGYLVLFADLTEVQRRERERRLAEGLARLGEMAAGVAHELRNSLATLSGYLTLIERRPEEGSVTDYLGEIRRETDHLGRVLEDFLAFARPGTARTEEVDLAALVRRVAGDPALAGAPVIVRAGADARLPGDPQLLERLLRNLLRNAVEAEGRAGVSGSVEVTLHRGPEGLEVTVEDRGPGLPPEVRDRLFHPFVTGRPGGVGLGLAVSHRIATLHGGNLTLEDRPGGGTRARLLFPGDTSG